MTNNIFDKIPDNLPSELTEVLLNVNNIRIERIISGGHTSPEKGWYDQEESEWVILLEGQAKITFDDSSVVSLSKGDYLFIPPRRKHKVTFTSENPKCVWLAVFFQ